MDRIDDLNADGAGIGVRTDAPRPLPDTVAEQFFVEGIDGVRVACYAWRDVPEGAPALIWGHANGFNAGCYAPVLARLAQRFRVFAYDARGQGASEKPDGEPSHTFAMDRLAEDLRYIVAAVRQRIGPDCPLHYASHSMGGNAALLLEGRFQEAPFQSLTLFEPPIHPPKGHEAYDPAWGSSPILAKWSTRRRDRFPDRKTLRQEAQKIVTFARFAPEMMDAYVQAAAHATEGGDLKLFCPGPVEAAFYTHCPPAGVFDAAGRVKTPTWIFSSDPAAVDAGHVWAPPVIRDVAATMDNAEYRIMPGCRHLMVQEDPDGCVAEVIAHIESVD